MKHLISSLLTVLVFLLSSYFSHAQHILKSNGKFGISAEDGTILLPVEYDTVYAPNAFSSKSLCLVYRKGGKYGILNKEDGFLSGLIFDEIKIDNESYILKMRQGDKWGFMTIKSSREESGGIAPEKAVYRYIPPQYDALWSNRTDERDFVSVKDHNQFGLLSVYTGDTIVPIRFPYDISEVGQTNGFPLYTSGFNTDLPNDTVYIYNPKTDVTIPFHERADITRSNDNPFIFGLHQYINNTDNHGLLQVFDYGTGKRLYHYDIIMEEDYELYDTKFEMLDDSVLKIVVEYRPADSKYMNFYKITCVDVYSHYIHYSYEGFNYKDLELLWRDENTSELYRMKDYRKYLPKNHIGTKMKGGPIIWHYERFRED